MLWLKRQCHFNGICSIRRSEKGRETKWLSSVPSVMFNIFSAIVNSPVTVLIASRGTYSRISLTVSLYATQELAALARSFLMHLDLKLGLTPVVRK